jgi:hypothetical protein
MFPWFFSCFGKSGAMLYFNFLQLKSPHDATMNDRLLNLEKHNVIVKNMLSAATEDNKFEKLSLELMKANDENLRLLFSIIGKNLTHLYLTFHREEQFMFKLMDDIMVMPNLRELKICMKDYRDFFGIPTFLKKLHEFLETKKHMRFSLELGGNLKLN